MRRNNVSRGRRSTSNSVPTGSLMTDHLKLQDLDLELELLKRKREIIEEQQRMLANERQHNNKQRQFGYDQPRQNYPQQQQQYNDNQNFSDYHNAPSFSNHSGSGLLGKRAGKDREWHTPPKRFSGSQRGGGRKRFSGGPSPDTKPRPLPLLDQKITPPRMQQGQFSQNSQVEIWNKPPAIIGSKSVPPSRRFNDNRPPKSFHRDFKPRKITKNKAPPSSTVPKLVSYPIPQRKTIVGEISHMVKEVDQSSDFILHPDKVPTQQTAGRLELALGSILKNIKTEYGETKEHGISFQSQFLLRQMKHAIRERLRRVMLGKYVGKLDDIVEQYRKVFPQDTDSEIVQIALDAQKAIDKKQLAIKIEDADTAEKYYRLNMNNLITASLDEMFEKLFEIYGADCTESLKNEYKDILMSNEDFTKDIEPNDNDGQKSTEVFDVVIREDGKKEDLNKEEENTKTENTADEEEKEQKETKVETPDKGQEETKVEVLDEEQEEMKVADPEKDEKKIDEPEKKIENKAEDDDQKEEEEKTSTDREITRRVRRMDNMIYSLLKRRLSIFLPKYKEQIIKILDLKSMYRSTKEYILTKVQDKIIIDSRMDALKKLNETKKKLDTSVTSVASTPPRVLPYYVKIFGRPVLPKRRLMQSFLQQFNPKSIKKHRNMHLLFVGFADKEDYNKIVAVKQTVIGNSTITIKVSEKTIDLKNNDVSVGEDDVQIIDNQQKSGSDDVQIVEDDENQLNNKSTDVADVELDDQINDLLSSIRKEEEKTDDIEELPNETGSEETQEPPNKKDTEKDVDSGDMEENTITIEELENGNTDGEPEGANTGLDDDNDVKTDDGILEKELIEESKDKVASLKADSQEPEKTPTRSSARLANVTPSTIRTRRSSKLAQ